MLLFFGSTFFFVTRADNTLNIYYIQQQEVHNGTIIKGAQEIKIDGEVNGDLYLIASRITINGKVNGNVYLMASSIEIGANAIIQNSANLIAQNIDIMGQIGSGANLAGENITFQNSAVNNGGLLAAGSKIFLKGLNTRDVFLLGESVEINSKHLNKTSIASNNIIIGEQASIKDLDYRSHNKANIINSASIQGVINEKITMQDNKPKNPINHLLKGLLSVLVFVSVMTFFFPRLFSNLGEIAIKRFPRSILYGFISFLFIIVATFLLLLIILMSPRLLLPFLSLGFGVVSLMFMVPIGIVSYLITRNKELSSSKLLLATLLAGAILLVARTLSYRIAPEFTVFAGFLIILWSFGTTMVFLFERSKQIRASSGIKLDK